MVETGSGRVELRELADGTRAFRLRFMVHGRRELVTLHERSGCECGCGGNWSEPAARNELGNALARVRAGVWQSRRTPAAAAQDARRLTFHEYASDWLQAKAAGVLGEKPIDASSYADYRWRLSCHLLPFFGPYPLTRIDRALCLRFKAEKLREAQELREAIAGGAVIRDKRGRRRVPLSPASIRKLIDTLAAILEDAVEDELLDSNPARGKRMRVRVPKPEPHVPRDGRARLPARRGRAQDAPLTQPRPAAELGFTAALVAHLLAQGYRPAQIAKRLGLAKSTVSYHLARLNANSRTRLRRPASDRRDPRARRLARQRAVRPADRAGAPARPRRRALPHPGLEDRGRDPRGPDDAGPRRGRDRAPRPAATRSARRRARRATWCRTCAAGACTASASASSSTRRLTRPASSIVAQGLPPLPHTTPHTLRRTYISIALLANNFDVKWVMGQVGHADSRMTMDVYAQLEQRAKRDHGASFDRLVRAAPRARARRHQALPAAPELAPAWHRPSNRPRRRVKTGRPVTARKRPEQAKERMARPRFELGTPRFSVVCSTN